MSAGSRPKDFHADAAAIVLTLLLDAVRTSRLEPPAVPDGTHDIDLWQADDRKIAIEVTRIIRGAAVAQVRALPGWETTTLQLSWFITLRDEHVKVKGRRQIIEDELALLEAAMGVLPVTGGSSVSAIEIDPVPSRLAGIDVIAVDYFPLQPDWANRPQVGQVMFRPLSGAFAPMEDAFPEVEQAAVDNLDKLRRAEADERHLFIWVGHRHATLGTWKFEEHLPTLPLNIPEGVDAVWIAPTWHGDELSVITDRVWCFRPGEGWSFEQRSLDLFRALDGRTHLRLGPSSVQEDNEATRAMIERMRQIIE